MAKLTKSRARSPLALGGPMLSWSRPYRPEGKGEFSITVGESEDGEHYNAKPTYFRLDLGDDEARRIASAIAKALTSDVNDRADRRSDAECLRALASALEVKR